MTPADLALIHAAANSRERPWSEAEFADLLAHPATILTGDSRSFVLGRVVLDEAEVLTLATHPDHQRQGLARAALTAFERVSRQRSAKTCFLEVAEDNHPAKALYLSNGYAQIGRRRGYYHMADGAQVAALVLQKTLPAA